MAKKSSKKTTTKAKSSSIKKHRSFRPSYDAHPLWHLFATAVVVFIMGMIVFSTVVYFSYTP